jgi:hypothetical protein
MCNRKNGKCWTTRYVLKLIKVNNNKGYSNTVIHVFYKLLMKEMCDFHTFTVVLHSTFIHHKKLQRSKHITFEQSNSKLLIFQIHFKYGGRTSYC